MNIGWAWLDCHGKTYKEVGGSAASDIFSTSVLHETILHCSLGAKRDTQQRIRTMILGTGLRLGTHESVGNRLLSPLPEAVELYGRDARLGAGVDKDLLKFRTWRVG